MDKYKDSLDLNQTVKYEYDNELMNKPREILTQVYKSLKQKGYNPTTQLVGYLLSGDPTYVTNYENARSLIRQIERDELLEEILDVYLKHLEEN